MNIKSYATYKENVYLRDSLGNLLYKRNLEGKIVPVLSHGKGELIKHDGKPIIILDKINERDIWTTELKGIIDAQLELMRGNETKSVILEPLLIFNGVSQFKEFMLSDGYYVINDEVAINLPDHIEDIYKSKCCIFFLEQDSPMDLNLFINGKIDLNFFIIGINYISCN